MGVDMTRRGLVTRGERARRDRRVCLMIRGHGRSGEDVLEVAGGHFAGGRTASPPAAKNGSVVTDKTN